MVDVSSVMFRWQGDGHSIEPWIRNPKNHRPVGSRRDRMTSDEAIKNQSSHLILARTHRDRIRDNLTVIMKGEGVRVFDQDGKCYLDLEAGMTRPVHVGYGRKEIARPPMTRWWSSAISLRWNLPICQPSG